MNHPVVIAVNTTQRDPYLLLIDIFASNRFQLLPSLIFTLMVHVYLHELLPSSLSISLLIGINEMLFLAAPPLTLQTHH